MKVKATKNCPYGWERIEFPTFRKGTAVKLAADREEGDDYFVDWFAAEVDGHETFVPVSFIKDGKLIRDYNPTELEVKAGGILEVVEIVNAWLIAKDNKGRIGWIPAENVVSMRCDND